MQEFIHITVAKEEGLPETQQPPDLTLPHSIPNDPREEGPVPF